MSFTITRIISKKVKKCPDCPYFVDHPYESDCDHPSTLMKRKSNPYYGLGLVNRLRVPESCPERIKD